MNEWKEGAEKESDFCLWLPRLTGGSSPWQSWDLESYCQGPFFWALPPIDVPFLLDTQFLQTPWVSLSTGNRLTSWFHGTPSQGHLHFKGGYLKHTWYWMPGSQSLKSGSSVEEIHLWHFLVSKSTFKFSKLSQPLADIPSNWSHYLRRGNHDLPRSVQEE